MRVLKKSISVIQIWYNQFLCQIVVIDLFYRKTVKIRFFCHIKTYLSWELLYESTMSNFDTMSKFDTVHFFVKWVLWAKFFISTLTIRLFSEANASFPLERLCSPFDSDLRINLSWQNILSYRFLLGNFENLIFLSDPIWFVLQSFVLRPNHFSESDFVKISQ